MSETKPGDPTYGAGYAEAAAALVMQLNVGIRLIEEANKRTDWDIDRRVKECELGVDVLRDASRSMVGRPDMIRVADECYISALLDLAELLDIKKTQNKQGNKVTYLIKDSLTGMVKIGQTQDIDKRLRALQCGSGGELSLVATLPGNKEYAVHKKFRTLRKRGEWFEDSEGEILEFFQNQCDRLQ